MDLSFRNMLGPLAWLAILAVPWAIFALYFLKLKRTPLEVPSTYLWHRVIEDLHVNSLWQRFRRSLLLFLQLLLVVLAIGAVLRPGWQGEQLQGRKFIFLVDNSASMSSQDLGENSRLAIAKKQLSGLIDQLDASMSAMIVSYSDRPDVVQEFTDNRRLLHEAVERIEPTSDSTAIRGALELADGFANPTNVALEEGGTEFAIEQEEVDLYILSDGRFGPVDGFSLGNLQPSYLPIGSVGAENLAITALNSRRHESRPEHRAAFVQVANFSQTPQSVVVELYLNGRLVDAAEIEVPAGQSRGITFDLGEAEPGKLMAKLTPAANFQDALPLDNRAYAVIDNLRNSRALLITPGNFALETALNTARAQRLASVAKRPPDDLKTPELQRLLRSEAYDLVIFDQCAPEEMPTANTLFIGRVPPLEAWQAESSTEPQFGPQLIDWDRGHPLLNLVELGNVQIVDSVIVDPPPGGRVLVDSTKGPVVAIAPRGPFEDAVVGFEIVGRDKEGNVTINTNWTRSYGFPNFCLNTLEYLAGGGTDVQLQTNGPGESVEFALREHGGPVTVVRPDGASQQVKPSDQGRYAFHDTDLLGVYEVNKGEEVVYRFAVNLFDREESDVALREREDEDQGIQTVESISIGYVDVAAQNVNAPARKELWKWLLLAVLFVLVLEWYIYNRRVYV